MTRGRSQTAFQASTASAYIGETAGSTTVRDGTSGGDVNSVAEITIRTGVVMAMTLLTNVASAVAQVPAVGTRSFEIEAEVGPVHAQAWYPTADTTGRDHAPRIVERSVLEATLDEVDLRFADASTRSYLRAAPLSHAGKGWPLLLFSHGLGSRGSEYTLTIEALVRRGFVVIAVDHRGGAESVAYADGSVVRLDPAWEENSPPAVPVMSAFRFAEEQADHWATELVGVLDRLEDLPGGLGGVIDPTAVGAFGHSMGGKATTALCMRDPRARACANLDGWPVPASAEVHGLQQPYLLVEDVRDVTNEELASWNATLDEYVRNMQRLHDRKRRMMRQMGEGSAHVMIPGIRHESFQDWWALDPEFRPEGASRDPGDTRELTVAILSQFFGEHLDGKRSRMLHPDAIIEVFDPTLWSREAADEVKQ